uniref:OmpA domain-containing protein n=1 Tax=uncultured prokaryote TaxID=198431 RepID=H5SGA2_9ZZZZ|nr:OmpA domain-containing protein [uncultured prokaryote]
MDRSTSQRTRFPHVVIAGLMALLLTLGTLGLTVRPVAAASCATSSPSSGAYLVTVCLSRPPSGALLSGAVTVEASATTSGSAPRVQRMLYTLDGNYLLTEFFAPYQFTLPTTQFVDGQHTLTVSALMSDGFVSSPASITLFFQNGVTTPPPIPTGFQPTTGSTPPSGQPFRIAAVGDGGNDGTYSAQVAQLIASLSPNMFLYLGDLYEKGSYTEFLNYYGTDGSLYSAFRAVTNPVVGNHEYEGGITEGYLRYWHSPPSYYSVDAGGWHIIALNSTSQFGQFAPGTPQYEWLLSDLQAHRDGCTIAYFHHPRFSIGPEGDTPALQPIWELLYQFGVELVLAGHDHNYQRWVPLDRNGQPDPNGINQIVAGTGGHGIRGFARSDARVAAGFDLPPAAYGALLLELFPSRADIAFIDLRGQPIDSTAVTCHGPNDSTPPTTPTGLQATAISSTQVVVKWNPSSDDYAVTTYEIVRDGNVIATVPGTITSYIDKSLSPDQEPTYRVRALDAVGNRSEDSEPVTPTGGQTLLSEDFESGTLAGWNVVNSLVITTDRPAAGSFAARALSTTGTPGYASRNLPSSVSELSLRLQFFLAAQGTNTVYLLKFRNTSGGSVGGVYLSSNGRLGFRNDVIGKSSITSTLVTPGTWHTVQVHIVTGNSGLVEVWYDSTRILQLTQDLGISPIGSIQLGENSSGRTFDIRFDNLKATTASAPPPDTTPPETTLTGTPPGSTEEMSATFTFTANEPATFRCSLDGSPAGPCTSPASYANLMPGTHVFSVAAVDAAGNIDPTPATYSWEVVARSAPETMILSTPPSLTNLDSATFTFTSNDAAATFECQLDASTGIACTSPWLVTSLSEGSHTFSVRAINGEGEPDPTPATWSWTIDRTPPPAPSSLTASATSGNRVELSWSAVSDDNGIAGYDVYRDGSLLVSLGPVTSAIDATVQPASTYRYTVRARDNAGNISVDSPIATMTTPSLRLFEDDFESGTLVRWSSVNGLTVTTEAPFSGSYAARAFSTAGTASYALATLPRPVSEFSLRIRLLVTSQGTNAVNLVKWRSGISSLGGISLTSSGQLAVRNDVAAQGSTTSTTIAASTWHTLELHVRTGSDGFVEIWYDGTRIHQSFQNFGTNQVTAIQLGENSTGRLFDVRFDDVAVDTGPIDAPADTTPPETTLTSTPPASTDQTTATFAFAANELATFRCSVDGAPWQLCTSPFTVSDLAIGPHTFRVTATDIAGNADLTPATYAWEIALATPETTLTGTPAAVTNRTDATFSFIADDPTATFQCQLDSSTPIACTSPLTLDMLSEGDHTFSVWAINPSGTADPTPATWTWTVDLTPPPAPSGVTAVAGNGRVTITWQAVTDRNGIAGYDVYRDGTLLVSLGDTTSYVDTTVQASTSYSYAVSARDQVGNASPPSASVTVTTGTFALFADDFESGTLAAWSTVSGLAVTTDQPYSGQYAARAFSTSGTAAYAYASLPSTTSDVYVRIRFFVSSQGANTVYLLKVRTAGGASLGGIFISSTGKLGFRNDVTGQSTTTTTTVTPGTWHTLLLHVVVTSGSVEVSYDGSQIATISGNLGTEPIGRFQLGENSTGRTFDIRFDEVVVDTQPIAG